MKQQTPMQWDTEYLNLLFEYAGLCSLDVDVLKNHIENDLLGYQQFVTWADCLPIR